MLRLNLQPIFKARGIDRPHAFLVRAGFTAHSAHVIVNSHLKVVKLQHIEILCEKLNCEPNDLLLWTPDNNNPIADSHPLYNLRDTRSASETTLRDMPYKQLKELTLKLSDEQKERER